LLARGIDVVVTQTEQRPGHFFGVFSENGLNRFASDVRRIRRTPEKSGRSHS